MTGEPLTLGCTQCEKRWPIEKVRKECGCSSNLTFAWPPVPGAQEMVRRLMDKSLPQPQRQSAAETLKHTVAWSGSEVPAVVQYLVGAITEGGLHAARSIAVALGEAGAAGGPAVPFLSKLLTDRDDTLRALAAQSLGRLGPVAQPAVPALVRLLRDKSDEARRSAAAALGAIGDPTAVSALARAVADPNDAVCGSAVASLEAFGGDAAAAVPALRKALPRVGAAGPAIVAILGDDGVVLLAEAVADKQLGSAAASALRALGPDALAAVPLLKKLAWEPEVGERARDTLRRVDFEASAEVENAIQRVRSSVATRFLGRPLLGVSIYLFGLLSLGFLLKTCVAEGAGSFGLFLLACICGALSGGSYWVRRRLQ